MIRIALDVMGGDNAPVANLEGALDALSRSEHITVLLVGDKELIEAWLRDKSNADAIIDSLKLLSARVDKGFD